MKQILVFAFTTLSWLAQAQFFEIRFTNPVCAAYPNKPQGSYCTRADLPASIQDANGPLQSILREIANPVNTRITLATMTFSHRGVAEALCQAEARGTEVQVLIDAEAEAAVAESVKNCGGTLILVGEKEGEGRRGDLHHNKFLLIERGSDRDSMLVFSTANFSNPGLSINHETWGFVSASQESAFIQNHLCLVDNLIHSSKSRRTFRAGLEACRKDDQGDRIQSYFLPTDSSPLLAEMDRSIRSSKRVWMSSNRFSFVPLIERFGERNSNQQSRAIFDDDLYWASVLPDSDQYRGNVLDAERIADLSATGVTVRYTQTSFEAAQKMHNKFMVLDDQVIVGAGNFTTGGLKSNFENFYVIRDPKVVQDFANYFEKLWGLSSAPRDIK
jgi:phosphatidylserine/phosphatidylglycerophosphate/cardiolipin synthase-like enzyme